MAPFHKAARGELDNFVLVMEGSIPNEKISGDGYWAAYGTDPQTGNPITIPEWLDRLAAESTRGRHRRNLLCLRRHPCDERQRHRLHGRGRLSRLGLEIQSGLPIVNVPGCPVQPDNFMETLLYLLRQLAGLAPMIPIDEAGRPKWLFGKTVHEGCDRAGYFEQADFTHEYGSPKCLVKIGCWGPVVQCNVPKRGWMAGNWRMPQCRRNLHRLHDARLSGQVHAIHGPAARLDPLVEPDQALWRADPRFAPLTNATLNDEPKWRHNRPTLTTGYQPPR